MQPGILSTAEIHRKDRVTVIDLLSVANETVSMTFDPFTPLVIAAALYWLMVQFILYCFRYAEQKLALQT